MVSDVYDIGRMVNEVPNVLCPQSMASKHLNYMVQDRLNNVLMGRDLICQGESLLPYHG